MYSIAVLPKICYTDRLARNLGYVITLLGLPQTAQISKQSAIQTPTNQK